MKIVIPQTFGHDREMVYSWLNNKEYCDCNKCKELRERRDKIYAQPLNRKLALIGWYGMFIGSLYAFFTAFYFASATDSYVKLLCQITSFTVCIASASVFLYAIVKENKRQIKIIKNEF